MNVPLVTHLFVFLYYYDCGHLQYLLLDWQDEWDGDFSWRAGWRLTERVGEGRGVEEM